MESQYDKANTIRLTDFGRIQKENYYYVDKTMFIEKIEMQPSYLFLIRPRRFGKSLTLAMLEAYYDVRYADQFDEFVRPSVYRAASYADT